MVALITIVAKFTDEQYTTINQLRTGCFDPRIFANCLQGKQLSLYAVDKDPQVETSCPWLINSCVLLSSEFCYRPSGVWIALKMRETILIVTWQYLWRGCHRNRITQTETSFNCIWTWMYQGYGYGWWWMCPSCWRNTLSPISTMNWNTNRRHSLSIWIEKLTMKSMRMPNKSMKTTRTAPK